MDGSSETKSATNVNIRKNYVLSALPTHKALHEEQLRLFNFSIPVRRSECRFVRIESDRVQRTLNLHHISKSMR